MKTNPIQEHRAKAVERTLQLIDPNQKGRQNARRFCNYCRTNEHAPCWCRKKIRDEELKRIKKRKNCCKKVTFTQDHNKKRGPYDRSKPLTRSEDLVHAKEKKPKLY